VSRLPSFASTSSDRLADTTAFRAGVGGAGRRARAPTLPALWTAGRSLDDEGVVKVQGRTTEKLPERGDRVAGVTSEDIDWAQDQARSLAELTDAPFDPFNPYKDKARLIAVVEFLRLKAGARSQFYLQAVDAVKRWQVTVSAPVVAGVLVQWVDFVERGISEMPVEAQARAAAANDLMEQVETLLQDKRVHPAAPVMLAGAALEEMLRSLVDTAEIKVKGKPGITSYANALREAEVLSVQEVKDVTSWGGMRNEAAHGKFDRIELANAGLMAQGINFFMQRHRP
jgi:hypothetical protein